MSEITLYNKGDKSSGHVERYKNGNKDDYILKEDELYFINDDVVRKVFGKYESGVERRCEYEDLTEYKGENFKKEIDLKLQKGDYILKKNNNGKHFICRLENVSSMKKKMYSIIQGFLSEQGKKDLLKIGFSDEFSYPKPVELLKLLIDSVCYSDTTILDFFAGSGTTGQAVLELNREDGGNRQFILVTNNEFNKKEHKYDYKASIKEREYWSNRVHDIEEALKLADDLSERQDLEKDLSQSRVHLKTYEDKLVDLEEYGICTAVTYPRLINVIEGFHLPDGQNGTGGNLRYYRVDYEPYAEVDALEFVYRIAEKCGGLIAFKEKTYTPMEGLSPTAGFKVYESADKIVAIHTSPLRTEALKEIEQILMESDKPEKVFYSFTLAKDSKFGRSEYVEWNGIRVKPFPQDILNHYRRLAEKISR